MLNRSVVCRPAQTRLEQSVALLVRWSVFVDEMNVSPEDEFDADDARAFHLLAFVGDQVAGTARLVVHDPNGPGDGRLGQIGRVAVLPIFRSLRVGSALMEFFHHQARDMQLAGTWVGAVLTAVPFYERLGYRTQGPTYLSEGHPSVRMYRVTPG